jgi:arylformamidase
MTGTPIYRDYDQDALNLQYNARASVPDHLDLIEAWTSDSIRARQELPCRLDVAFGPSPQEVLDIFPADDASGPAPVQVFFHGGYWRAFHKDDFSFVARAFAAKGAAVVVVNYALIPTVDMDELVRQCRAALGWVHRNAASFGGDAGRVFVSGHSAGGHLVATMMATDWPAFDGLPDDILKGGCSVSGLFDLEPIRLGILNEELNLSTDDLARHSPLHLEPRVAAPLILAVGGDESDEFHRHGDELAAAWGSKGAKCRVLKMAGLNHFSILEGMRDPESDLAQAIHDQMGIG